MRVIDTHCHLDYPDFDEEREAIIKRALNNGVMRMVTIATHVQHFERVLKTAQMNEAIYCSVGTHPHHAKDELDVTSDQIIELAKHPKVVAIGEAGLDYFYENSPPQDQEKSFRMQIAAARQTGLPLIIHSRDADEDMANILTEEMQKGAFKAVLHCFSSGQKLAETGLQLGLYISLSGILTFKRSHELRDIAKAVPKERLLVETDAPFLSPQSKRGQRNEPSYVIETAKILASLHHLTEEEMSNILIENSFRFFDKMPAFSEEEKKSFESAF